MNQKKPPKKNKAPNNNFLRSGFFIMAVFLGIVWVTSFFNSTLSGLVKKLSYSDFYYKLEHNLENPQIESVKLIDNLIQGTFTDTAGGGRFYLHIPQEDKDFLKMGAVRHLVFNYENIADYYANSPKEVQRLMEKSALVVIDFEQAITQGYVKLCESIKRQYLIENPEHEK